MNVATVAPAPPHLSAEEKAAYARDGIVIPQSRLSAAAVGRLRDALDRLIADNPDRRPEQLVNAHLREGPEGVRGNDVFLDMARDPAVVELVAGLVGPDVILWGCQVFCKPGGDGMEVPWHQDGHYWPIRPLATTTAWIAIDDSTTENGCMRVIPGSHAAGSSLTSRPRGTGWSSTSRWTPAPSTRPPLGTSSWRPASSRSTTST